MAYCFIRQLPEVAKNGDRILRSKSLRNVDRVSVWISDKLAQISGEELENLLVVHVWFTEGDKAIYEDCIDVEVF